ncbi:MAG: hypothetical protein IIA64_04870 [Planctomycetes bacterium]|nr:hypothetical protein [Planctomycetota bacterium]
MAVGMQFTGVVLDSAGAAIADGVNNVELFSVDQTTTAVAQTSTSSGLWSFDHSTQGRFDRKITDGSNIIWLRARDQFQVTTLQARSPTTAVPAGHFMSTTDEAQTLVAVFAGRRATETAGVETAANQANGDRAYIDLELSNNNATPQQFVAARIEWEVTDIADASEDGQLNLWTMVAGTLTEELHLDATALWPETNDGLALGKTTLAYSDAFFASGAVIDFNAGDVTWTHSSGVLTLGGDGTVVLTFGANVDLSFTGTTGTNDITLTDSLADALSITRGGTDMMLFDSNTPRITITPATTITGALTLSSTLSSGPITVGTTALITAATDADDVIVDNGVNGGISILAATTGNIAFGDAADANVGLIQYVHSDNAMKFSTSGDEHMQLDSAGNLKIEAGQTLSFDGVEGARHTYIYEESDDDLHFTVGNVIMMEMDQDTLEVMFNNSNVYMKSESYLWIGPDSAATGFVDGSTTVGLIVNQEANDDNIITGKSSDVAHGMTALQETDTWFAVKKLEATSGGVNIQGFKDANGTAGHAIYITGLLGEAADTTTTSGGVAVITLDGRVKSGTGNTAVADTGNIVNISTNGVTRWLIQGNGDVHQTTDAHTALDEWDDAMLLRAYSQVTAPDVIIRDKWDEWVDYNEPDLIAAGVLGKAGKYGLTNTSQLMRLHTGAIWQQATKHMSLVERVDELEGQLAIANTALAALTA